MHEETQKFGVNSQIGSNNVCSVKENGHTSNTGRQRYKKTALIETYVKYDLELRFKPKQR